ncbi:MAG: hypothetical protein KBS74_06835 [Clostridiales bacterium]|nr:hypothetical protein [Candidatus Cacconaster stercorequi]
MDFNHCDHFNYLLTRKCSCGGTPEMLVDFVDDFEVRCSKCHRSTHAYMKPEDAAAHWNDGSDITDTPLDIFRDDPDGYLCGEIVAIHIAEDEFMGISHQSCDFTEAIFEYTDRRLHFEHEEYEEDGAINIGECGSFNPQYYKYIVRPESGSKIRFEKIIYTEDGRIDGIAFRWDDTWLFVFTDEYNLILTRSSFDLSDDSDYPVAHEEPSLSVQVDPSVETE